MMKSTCPSATVGVLPSPPACSSSSRSRPSSRSDGSCARREAPQRWQKGRNYQHERVQPVAALLSSAKRTACDSVHLLGRMVHAPVVVAVRRAAPEAAPRPPHGEHDHLYMTSQSTLRSSANVGSGTDSGAVRPAVADLTRSTSRSDGSCARRGRSTTRSTRSGSSSSTWRTRPLR
jgi:hypothetical protein